jgi:hypothetical protein
MIDCLVGHALLGTSNGYLIRQRKMFTPVEANRVIAAIRRAEDEHEPIERIIQRDIAFCERAFGWYTRLTRIVNFGADDEDNSESVKGTVKRWRALNRLLMTDLALREFKHNRGQYPGSLTELVPDYLESVPLDPFSGQPLIYRLTDDAFVLYSVGKDGTDNGGRFASRTDIFTDGFDLDVETPTRQ